MAHKSPLTDLERGYVHQCIRVGQNAFDTQLVLMFSRLTGKSLEECHGLAKDIQIGIAQGRLNFNSELEENLNWIKTETKDLSLPEKTNDS